MGYGLGVDYSLPGAPSGGATAKAGVGAASGAAAGSVGGPIGAGIGALVGLVGGLFGAAAQREQQKREIMQKAAEGKLQANSKAADTMLQGTQNGFAQLINSYRGLYGG